MASKSLIKKLDIVFSKYIRLRDSTNGMFICCSCGQMKPYEMADAGHFINRRWMSVRWREDNVHAQCSACNRFDEGNAAGYARFMDKKYGPAHVDSLMALKNAGQKWSDFEVELLIKEYKQKTKDLLEERKSANIM